MKKIIFALFAMAILACSPNKTSDDKALREQAKNDIIQEFKLPQETTFDENSIEITSDPERIERPNVDYIVSIKVKSEDQDGNEIVKTHRIHYLKVTDAVTSENKFEVIFIE